MSVELFTDYYRKLKIEVPSLHIVLGSGLSGAFGEINVTSEWVEMGSLRFNEVPGLPGSGVDGHPGVFKYFQNLKTKKVLCFQAGRLHGYEGHSPKDVVKPVLFAKLAGCPRFLLTNAAGSLKREILPGSVMILSDHVNMTGTNPLYGPNPVDKNGKAIGPRFPDLSDVYDKSMRAQLKISCQKKNIPVHEGIYLGLGGPTFETPAEVSLYASWGLGAVGMSTVWEAIALKHAGATVVGASVISNLGCGLGDQPLSHAEVEENGRKIGRSLLETLFDFGANYAK
jgi:purine-nucleoside phosphorylase